MAQEKTTRERLEKTIDGMVGNRRPFEADWDEIARLALPNKVDVRAPSNTAGRRRANTATHDSGGTIAARRLTNGIATGLTNSSQPWFKLTVRDPELADYHPVKEWLSYVERVIYWVFAKTNYYDATKMQYADLGVMGCGAVLGVEHPQYMAVWHHMPVGSYHISLDEGLRVNRLVRYTRPTIENLYSMVAGDTKKLSDQAKNAYDKGDYHVCVPCVHVIERNDRVGGGFKSPGVMKPWRSVKWEIGNPDKKILLSEKGFDNQPFTAPRWETVGAQVYCDTAPGFQALPDMRELQLDARNMARLKANLTKPALAIPAGLARTQLSLDPGTINYIDAQSGDVAKPILQTDPRAVTEVRNDMNVRQRRIEQLFYADLFMAITDMEGVQPRNEQELLFRNEEKLTQLGPVIDRVNIEKLEADIDRAYTIAKNLGMLPPIPEALQHQPLAIEFISILARAQRSAQNTDIERAARFVGFVGGQFPEALLKFDAQQAVDEYTAGLGVNPSIIRSDEMVAEMMKRMEAQQQAAQVAANAAPARDAAEAAKLLSETQVDPSGTNALQRLLGQ